MEWLVNDLRWNGWPMTSDRTVGANDLRWNGWSMTSDGIVGQ